MKPSPFGTNKKSFNNRSQASSCIFKGTQSAIKYHSNLKKTSAVQTTEEGLITDFTHKEPILEMSSVIEQSVSFPGAVKLTETVEE